MSQIGRVRSTDVGGRSSDGRARRRSPACLQSIGSRCPAPRPPPLRLEACLRPTPPHPRPPDAAWGYGLATIAGDGTVLDTWFPAPQLGARRPRRCIAPAELEALAGADERRNVRRRRRHGRDRPAMPRRPRPPTPTCACTCSPTCSSRPNTINLDGIFGHLPDRGLDERRPRAPRRLRPPAPDAAARRHPAPPASTSSRGCSTTSRPSGCASPTPRACASARTSPPAPR